MYVTVATLVFVVATVTSEQKRKAAEHVLAAICGLGFVFSVYLTYLEAFCIHAWWTWCLTSALVVALLFVLVSIEIAARRGRQQSPRRISLRSHFAVVAIFSVLGVPAFVHLKHSKELPIPKRPPAEALKERLIRPDSHATGNSTAEITLVEFGDFQCEICGLEQAAIERLLETFGSRIRFVFRQFPVADLHPYAEKAAEASECAAEQNKFWEAQRLFYGNQSHLSVSSLKRDAAQMGLDVERFDSCLASGEMSVRVKRDIEDGRALGVQLTPTMFLGREEVVGAVEYDKLAELVNQQLASPEAIPVQRKSAESLNGVEKQSASLASPEQRPLSGSSPIPSGIGSVENVFTQYSGSGLGCSKDEVMQVQPRVIRTSEAKRLAATGQNAVFVDVREPQAYRVARIPGAINMPAEEIQQRYRTLPRDKVLVLYESGRADGSSEDVCAMSRAAGRFLLAHGFSHETVFVYQDGLVGWRNAGEAIAHSEARY